MTEERWFQLSFAQQMGNIGSELARARNCDEKNDLLQRERSFDRAFELIDLTIADPRWTRKLNELTRFREVVADWFAKTQFYDVSPASLEEYCLCDTLTPYRGES